MSVRKSLTGVLAAAVAGSALVMTAGPASATYRPDPDDTSFTTVSADLIGVGSDTTQHAMKLIADAWNADSAHTFKIATYAATEAGAAQGENATIPLPSGDSNRPNGSGVGKGKLYGAGNNTDIDFARSSDALGSSATTPPGSPEIENGLKAFPFALDTVVMAVSNTQASHAPAGITAADLVKIYECQVGATDWSDFGGTAGEIQPQVPQSGSGTAKFFKKQLDAAKGSGVTYGSCVDQTVQEHDDSKVMSNPDAIVPISKGRAELKGGTVRILNGFAPQRALYNVVRGADVTNSSIQAVFGENGFVCSAAANELIAAAGFAQLATPAHGGACGTAVESTSNFTVNATVDTTTRLTATSTAARAVKLVAKVTGSTTPTGKVSFYEGSTLLRAAVPLVSGQASLSRTGVAPGAHTYRAVYTPNDSIFLASDGSRAVTVKVGSRISESFPAKVGRGTKARGVVTVTGGRAKPAGRVSVMEGRKLLKAATLKAGKAKVTLPRLKKGKHALKIVYKGDAATLGSTKTFKITQK